MSILFILNDAPYGSERCYNALRLANALLKKDPAIAVTVFLMADAVSCARKGQKTPDGYYNIERMLKRYTTGAHRLLLCGTCMDARGLVETDLIAGASRSSMDELGVPPARLRFYTVAYCTPSCPRPQVAGRRSGTVD